MRGCASGGGTIRQTPTSGRFAAAGPLRKAVFRLTFPLDGSALACLTASPWPTAAKSSYGLPATRWKLRRAIKALNAVLASLRLEKHPDKTTIGRIGRGFDFLGFHFGPDGLQVARQTLANFMKKASWLYEQERNGAGAPDALGMYVRRWLGWARAALSCAGKDGKRRSAGNAVLLTILGDVALSMDGQNFLLPSSSPNDARINQFLPTRGGGLIPGVGLRYGFVGLVVADGGFGDIYYDLQILAGKHAGFKMYMVCGLPLATQYGVNLPSQTVLAQYRG
jgi:hypothetical protein